MALTSRPSKNINFAKINDIQEEFFGNEIAEIKENPATLDNLSIPEPQIIGEANAIKSAEQLAKNSTPKNQNLPEKSDFTKTEKNHSTDNTETTEPEAGSQRIADLLTTAKVEGIRYSSRPYTVPRSLTIDLTRLKSKFRTRDLQYTQNELMDQMVKESLEIVTADNYFSLREKALKLVKSPEQSSRRTVTLTERTVSDMAELKADLSLKFNRRISSDEIFSTLLAIAFSSLYENGLL